jgi:dipeptidyl aminopeptidase/acylaminoacyl peptidase
MVEWSAPLYCRVADSGIIDGESPQCGVVAALMQLRSRSDEPEALTVKRAALFCAVAVVFSLSQVRTATAQHKGLTPLDVARLKSVSEQAISPDGNRVAYVVSVQRDPLKGDSGGAYSELHVVETATGKSRPFITGKSPVGSIGWTPDGKGITFLTKRGDDKNTAIYVIPIDGGEAQKTVEHDTSISSYEWCPDGKRVAFLAKEKDDPEKKKLSDKGFNAEGYEEDLKPTRIWIAFADRGSEEKPRMLDVAGSASEIHWSPDGSQIAAAFAPTPLVDDYYMYRRIRIVNAESGAVVQKIENPGKLAEIAWNPNGKQLAFLSGEDINDPSEGRLMLADVATGQFRHLTDDYLPNVIDIHWTDEARIWFLGHNSCESEFGFVSINGGNARITIPEQAAGVVYESFSVCDDNRQAAMLGHSATHPEEVFTYNSETRGEKRLTNLNPWLTDKAFAKQEVVRYTARDGQWIEGVLVRPLNEEAGRRYPLMLIVHGGPESHVSNGWTTSYSRPAQVAAAAGYAVFFPNYRGSTGRGVAFAKDHQSDYGGKEFDDLLDGIDHLVESGLVERSKVGVTGGSYGGFASAWCATKHSEHFAAAVMFVGISNQISKSGTTDIPDEMFHVHARKRIWDDWEFFLKRSPIYYVQQAKTPILILHGKEDTRVHPSQSMELYRNLKILKQTPVRLVLYPGEGHGNRASAARYDYCLRLMRWMNHYLQGPGGAAPPFDIDHGLPQPEPKAAAE